MSFEFAYSITQGRPQTRFRDLDAVTLTVAAATYDGDVLPAGSEGTIVSVWQDGAAYLVEFAEPVGALISVAPDGIRPTAPAAP